MSDLEVKQLGLLCTQMLLLGGRSKTIKYQFIKGWEDFIFGLAFSSKGWSRARSSAVIVRPPPPKKKIHQEIIVCYGQQTDFTPPPLLTGLWNLLYYINVVKCRPLHLFFWGGGGVVQ
jgi:hypothetical protein